MKKFKKIYIEITNNCNLKCNFCSQNKRSIHYMGIEEFEDILNKIHNYTDNIYLHVKGEPLLHPNLRQFLLLAGKYNLNVNITTNGTLISKRIKDLQDIKALKKLNFSLHCEQNVNNYFEQIFDNVDKYLEDKTIIYRIWTLKNGNLDEKSTNVVNKIIEHYKLSTDFVEKVKISNNIKIKNNIYLDKDNEFIWPEESEAEDQDGYCMALKNQIAILSDGTVVPCCLDSNGAVKLGNIHNESLENILNSERYIRLKQSFNDRKPSEKLCKKCTFKNRFN